LEKYKEPLGQGGVTPDGQWPRTVKVVEILIPPSQALSQTDQVEKYKEPSVPFFSSLIF